jgi:pimeloyl-ACP methyl ester carboxylesterase
VRLHVAVLGLERDAAGADPAIVLIHGASGNLEDMRLAVGEKLASSHRVILIDRAGHGWSSRPERGNYASPARQADLVAGALEQLGVRRAILVGHSWGARLPQPMRLPFPSVPQALSCSQRRPIPGPPIQVGTTSLFYSPT